MMLYTGRDQALHGGEPQRKPLEERRTYARRIDCSDSGRRAEIPPSPVLRHDTRQAPGRRALDID